MTDLLPTHAGILAGTITVYIFCMDKLAKSSEKIKKISQLKEEIERDITQELKSLLEPIFENQPVQISPILNGVTEEYIEKPVNPVKGELFLDTLSKFVNGKSKGVSNLLSLRQYLGSWQFFHRLLKRLLIALASYEALCCSIYIVKSITKCSINNWECIGLFVPTALLVLAIISMFGLLEFFDSKIEDVEKEFHDL